MQLFRSSTCMESWKLLLLLNKFWLNQSQSKPGLQKSWKQKARESLNCRQKSPPLGNDSIINIKCYLKQKTFIINLSIPFHYPYSITLILLILLYHLPYNILLCLIRVLSNFSFFLLFCHSKHSAHKLLSNTAHWTIFVPNLYKNRGGRRIPLVIALSVWKSNNPNILTIPSYGTSLPQKYSTRL